MTPDIEKRARPQWLTLLRLELPDAVWRDVVSHYDASLRAAVAEEREACARRITTEGAAQLIWSNEPYPHDSGDRLKALADAIRARGGEG